MNVELDTEHAFKMLEERHEEEDFKPILIVHNAIDRTNKEKTNFARCNTKIFCDGKPVAGVVRASFVADTKGSKLILEIADFQAVIKDKMEENNGR